jgi:PKD repeat protein
VIKNESICETFESTNIIPDYSASYTFAAVGTYTLELTVDNGNGPKVLTKIITVTETPAPFVISRSQATRLFPFGSSPATLSVLFNQDFSGTVVEQVPLDFTLSFTSEGVVEIVGDHQTITWTVTATAGETKTFSYTYDAPDISPMYYKAGPLSLSPTLGSLPSIPSEGGEVSPPSGDLGGLTVFTEARTW